MYDHVSPEKLTVALRWLKVNNLLHADVDIYKNWLDPSVADDFDLSG